MSKRDKKNLNEYKGKLNRYFTEKSAFVKALPIFHIKQQGENLFKIEPHEDRIFLKSTKFTEDPYIIFMETWKNDNPWEYSYRFVCPQVKYADGARNQIEFEFRYESHPNIENHWPEHHLHIFEGCPPRYQTHRQIDFFDFFRIIENEFLSSN